MALKPSTRKFKNALTFSALGAQRGIGIGSVLRVNLPPVTAPGEILPFHW